MNNIKIAKELIKIAEDLFSYVDEYVETEHDKVMKVCQQAYKEYQKINVVTQIDLQPTLFTELDWNNLKIDNINRIYINLKLTKNVEYNITQLITVLKNANNHAKKIQSKIKSEFNKNVEIKFVLN